MKTTLLISLVLTFSASAFASASITCSSKNDSVVVNASYDEDTGEVDSDVRVYVNNKMTTYNAHEMSSSVDNGTVSIYANDMDHDTAIEVNAKDTSKDSEHAVGQLTITQGASKKTVVSASVTCSYGM